MSQQANIDRGKLRDLLESVDADNNNLIDKAEFLAMIERHSAKLARLQRSKVTLAADWFNVSISSF